jgi:hypothetical protein
MVTAMLDRLATLAALTMLALATAACGATTRGAATTETEAPRSTAFEAWSARSGTGAFFHAVGPANGTGVR